MGTWLDPIQHRLCSRPRCQLPIAGVGEAYGLCDGHGHEERNRRLAERDAKARTATQRPIVRGLTVTPVDRPLSAIVGARPVPVTIQPSAATEAAKEPSMAQILNLKFDPDTLLPSDCRILGCEGRVGNGKGARGLCSRHHAAAVKAGRLEELALPSTAPPRKPKAAVPAAPKPTPAVKKTSPVAVEPEPRLSREEQQIAAQQAHQEELAKLRAERDAALARAERAENAMYDLKKLVRFEFAYAPSVDLDLLEWARGIASKVREAKVRLEAAEKERADLQDQLTGVEESERDLLDESIELAKVLGADTDGDYDLIARAREVMAEIAQLKERIAAPVPPPGASLTGRGDLMWLRAERERAEAVERALHESQPWLRAAKECAEALGVTTPEELIEGAKALSLDQHPPAMIQRPVLPALPEPKPHRVKQAGGRDLGVLVGHVTESGLFRVTSGPLAGAVYGCLYRAEPIERPVLGEPTPDRDVWVRTSIDEVTAHNIHTADGGRFRRSEWGPARFAPVAKSTTSSAAVGDDDLPF